jgi:hypothetical protein
MVEGLLEDVVCTELILRGPLALDEIAVAQRTVGDWLAKQVSKETARFSLRLGRPALTPLAGTSAGVRTNLEIDPLTFVSVDGVVTDEATWLMPSASGEWQDKSMARVSQMDAVRLYNSRIDACVAFELTTPPDFRNRGQFRKQAARRKKGWKRSVFVMHSASLDLETVGTEPPDQTLEWSDQLRMQAWFHSSIQGGWSLEPMRHEQLADWDKKTKAEDGREEVRLAAIQEAHVKAGGKKVDPRIARHMVGLLKSDPLVEPELTTLTIADFISGTGIPSPVDPTKREFRATMCWRVREAVDGATLDELMRIAGLGRVLEAWSEAIGDDAFVIVHFGEFPELMPSRPTEELLNAIASALASYGATIDTLLESHSGRRATADYWMAKFFIDCRGQLPVPQFENPDDRAGRPEINTSGYFALMASISGTNF